MLLLRKATRHLSLIEFWMFPFIATATMPVVSGLEYGTIIFEPSYESIEAQRSVGLWINVAFSSLLIISHAWYVGALLSWLLQRKKSIDKKRMTFWLWFSFVVLVAMYWALFGYLLSLEGQDTAAVTFGFYTIVLSWLAPPIVAIIVLLVGKVRKFPPTKSRRLMMIGVLSQLSIILIYAVVGYLWWPTG